MCLGEKPEVFDCAIIWHVPHQQRRPSLAPFKPKDKNCTDMILYARSLLRQVLQKRWRHLHLPICFCFLRWYPPAGTTVHNTAQVSVPTFVCVDLSATHWDLVALQSTQQIVPTNLFVAMHWVAANLRVTHHQIFFQSISTHCPPAPCCGMELKKDRKVLTSPSCINSLLRTNISL